MVAAASTYPCHLLTDLNPNVSIKKQFFDLLELN